MNTIIMLFALPIGLFILHSEKKNQKKYQNIFDNFYKNIKNQTLTKKEKIKLYKEMLIQNHYNIKLEEDKIIGTKKIFSIGWMFIGIGTLYIGLLVYIVYFLYFQKPHKVIFKI